MIVLQSLPTVVGAAAVAPALLILWLVIAADERPGPPSRVWAAFLLGAASISLLGVARSLFAPMVHIDAGPMSSLALQTLFGVAAPEEIVKVIAIVAVSGQRRRFADPMDPIVYGAAAGLGFAAYENLAYLQHYPEMWRSLALLRSVLTVPFHGALGIIAGAYLAIARSGSALGAHRYGRDWAKIRTRLSILLVPIILHVCFDFPLLVLQSDTQLSGFTGFVFEATGMLFGFGTIGFAAHLVRRVGRHHAPRTELSRERLRNLRSMWAVLIAGGGAGFAGAAFVLTAFHNWLTQHDTVAANMAPIGLAAIAIGVALLLLAAGAYFQSRGRLDVGNT